MAGVNLPGESGQVGLTSEMSMAADGVDEDEEDGSFPTRVGDGEGRYWRPFRFRCLLICVRSMDLILVC